MTETIPLPTPPAPARTRRARLVVLVSLVALGAGGTGALAATVSRHADGTDPATPGAAVFIPSAALAAGGGGSAFGAAGTAVGVADSAPGAASAALAPAPQAGNPAGSVSSGTSIPYGYPGVCAGSAPAQVAGQVLTATGSATIGTAPAGSAYVLNAYVTSQTEGDASNAVAQVERRVTAVVNALAAAGVARGSIHTTNVSVYANSQRAFVTPAGPGTPAAAGATTVNASAGVSAELPTSGVIDRAVSAAAGAGAQNVNVSTQQSAPATPSADALSAALATAAGQAHDLAAAAAKATGVTLGAVRSVSTQQPTVCGYTPAGPQLVVGVTVAYAIG